MPEIRPLSEGDFPQIYETFLHGSAPGLTSAHYQPLFSPRDSQESCGYGLFDAGRLAGLLGTIVSSRVIAGRSVQVCNLHSWFVHPDYRGYSLGLMRPVLKRKDWTLTDLSPSPAVCTISLKLGFEWLDGRLTLLFRPWRREPATRSVEIITDRVVIRQRATCADAAVNRAVEDAGRLPLLVVDAEGECLLLGRTVAGRRRRHVYLDHLSNPACFARNSLAVRNALLDLSGTSFVAVETRRLSGQPRLPASWNLPVSTRQLIRRADVDPSEIDTLDTEAASLGMSFLPGKRLFLTAMASRFPRAGALAKRLLNWNSPAGSAT